MAPSTQTPCAPRRLPRLSLFLPALMTVALTGCGEDFQKEVAYVSGKVSCGGELITEGYVVFTPVLPPGVEPKNSGKSARGTIKSDGTYTLTTYDEDDGAVIGDHNVRVYRPEPEEDDSPEGLEWQAFPFACTNVPIRVTVSSEDDNTIDLDPANK